MNNVISFIAKYFIRETNAHIDLCCEIRVPQLYLLTTFRLQQKLAVIISLIEKISCREKGNQKCKGRKGERGVKIVSFQTPLFRVNISDSRALMTEPGTLFYFLCLVSSISSNLIPSHSNPVMYFGKMRWDNIQKVCIIGLVCSVFLLLSSLFLHKEK